MFHGNSEREILTYAQIHTVHLIILFSNNRMVTDRAFFGHRVDAIVSKAQCPVVTIILP
ncbi:hypothetical protein GNE08_10900 [Trichormus variabilis ARAD]|uniref:UspA domain-containing protein n=1 Tax=Trichormus variabilis N2B TaxID=2681315 RepID=A0ABR6S9H0_ANAVA|nr:hypothetical protein [Trichormus variabilis ARAD]MBC1256006.1 hypothetical protein [Trichormus variabilis V5]MBC1267378.1 hypothetical protein [Trichormus variabilis FSR]MBC1303066.1 hypothetical protein [Trichormus variabilis N2B]MBC1312970.1 hypothetical protein [Trichormus variabilis PNB]MBC1327529.1 hypothetical protein [Trichormus variabilis 9RC]MBD2378213.1 hypothetical protein [Trichormus variabilis FACHB-319]QFZ15940.1 hypothetical protein EH233_20775 [Anabaena sp. YBS01]QHD83129